MSKSALITGIIFIIVSLMLLFVGKLWILIYAVPMFIIGLLLIIFRNREDKIEEIKEIRKSKSIKKSKRKK